eukprot:2005635-Pyramimonas_sp.AAC.1
MPEHADDMSVDGGAPLLSVLVRKWWLREWLPWRGRMTCSVYYSRSCITWMTILRGSRTP